jgi:signal transduction histidine kinase
MIQKAHSIGATQLSQRLPVPETQDEIQGLARTLNEMLQRIEQAFQSQERFVADASHQLLTPLSILKGELEQSLKASKSEFSQPATLQSALQEVDHLISLVKNLLLLARVDAGLGAMTLQKLNLDDVVLDAISRVEKVARARDIRLKFDIQNQASEDERPLVLGDEDLLQNLVFNLLENAIKYSPPGSHVGK